MSLVELYPLLLTLGLVVFAISMIRLDRRISRGPLNAGNRSPERVKPPGQDGTPWELRNLDRQLRKKPERAQLIDMVNRLVTETGLGQDRRLALPGDATDDEIGAVVHRLEQHLGLPPLSRG